MRWMPQSARVRSACAAARAWRAVPVLAMDHTGPRVEDSFPERRDGVALRPMRRGVAACHHVRACPALCPRPLRLFAGRDPFSGDKLCSRKRSNSATGAAATATRPQPGRRGAVRSAPPVAKAHLPAPGKC